MNLKPKKTLNNTKTADIKRTVIAIIYRILEYYTAGSNGSRLIQSLEALPLSSSGQNIFSQLFMRVDTCSESEWFEYILGNLSFQADCLHQKLVDSGMTSPDNGNETRETKARIMLKVIGYPKGLAEYARRQRQAWLDFCQRMSSGKEQIEIDWSDSSANSTTKGNELMKVLLSMVLGPQQMGELDQAVSMWEDTFMKSPLFYLGIELMEKASHLGDLTPRFDTCFKESMSPIMKRIEMGPLRIPPIRYILDGIDQLTEERSLAQLVVFEEMARRARRNPLSVVEKQQRGKLASSIYWVVRHRLIDELRHFTAKERDVKITDSLDKEVPGTENEDAGMTLGDRVPSTDPSPEDIVILKEAFKLIISGLSVQEKEIVELIFIHGLKQKEVAERIHKSESYVSKINEKAHQKMINKCNELRHETSGK